jgi:RNA polymerase sigma-70 factor (ECF subfamily)
MWKSRPTQYSALSLKEVVCLCAEPCDDEAWEELVSRVGKPITAVIRRTAALWGNPSHALVEDILQGTYLKLWHGGRRLLRDLAVERPEAILAYLKKTATNATHDHFRHDRSQSVGGSEEHLSTSAVDPEADPGTSGNEDRLVLEVLLNEIDEYLKRSTAGSDQERDRTIFWLYFRQGMSTNEIASLPSIDLSPKGVGSVIERLKRCIRERVLEGGIGPGDTSEIKKENSAEPRLSRIGGL